MRRNCNRRAFCKTVAGTAFSPVLFSCENSVVDKERPNILWITSEDNGPFLGCYGDEYANTPNLDKFAGEVNGRTGSHFRSNAESAFPVHCTLFDFGHRPCTAVGPELVEGRYGAVDRSKLN